LTFHPVLSDLYLEPTDNLPAFPEAGITSHNDASFILTQIYKGVKQIFAGNTKRLLYTKQPFPDSGQQPLFPAFFS